MSGLKGHATIILENVETKEKRVIEEDNIVTNGFGEFLKGYGVCGTPIMKHFYDNRGNVTQSTPIKSLTGGLLLFGSNVEENPNKFYEVQAKVVGHAYDTQYLGDVPTMGSYNTSESGWIENGFKHVWDFATNQANGEIACAALTTLEGGQAATGFSKPLYDCKISMKKFHAQLVAGGSDVVIPHFQDEPYGGTFCASYLDGANNIIVQPKSFFSLNCYTNNKNAATGKYAIEESFLHKKSITLVEYHFPFTNYSPLDDVFTQSSAISVIERFENFSNSTGYIDRQYLKWKQQAIKREIDVEMPADLQGYINSSLLVGGSNYMWYTGLSVDEGFMYIYFVPPTKTGGVLLWPAGADMYVWKISMKDYSSTWFKVRNTTGVELTINWGNYFSPHFEVVPKCDIAYVTNDYTFAKDRNTGKLYIIDNADNTNVKTLWAGEDEEEVILAANAAPGAKSGLGGPLFRVGENFFLKGANSNGYMYNINPRTGEAQVIWPSDSGEWPLYKNVHGLQTSILACGTTGNTVANIGHVNHMTFCRMPFILMTINNLEQPVTKTNSETMKVIYTITRPSEE